MREKKSNKAEGVGLLVLAITFLVNPAVNIFDYLPDFIGYFIIAKALIYYADRAPYFNEARVGFLRLAYVIGEGDCHAEWLLETK